jgi:hypothetical protein
LSDVHITLTLSPHEAALLAGSVRARMERLAQQPVTEKRDEDMHTLASIAERIRYLALRILAQEKERWN